MKRRNVIKFPGNPAPAVRVLLGAIVVPLPVRRYRFEDWRGRRKPRRKLPAVLPKGAA